MSDENKTTPNKIGEQLEVAGSQLVDRVKELIEEGNVRKLIIRNPEGRVLLEIPLTIGVVAGGALFAFYPILAAVGALAALVAKVTIEVVREEPEATVQDVKEGAKNAKRKVEEAVDEARENLKGE